MYVCLCKGLREADIRQIALNGMGSTETVVKTLGLDDEDCCGRCARNIYELVALACGEAIAGHSPNESAACSHACVKTR